MVLATEVSREEAIKEAIVVNNEEVHSDGPVCGV